MEMGRRERVAAEIRAELARKQRTLLSLCAETGIRRSTLARRLSGEKPFYVHELESICSFLDLPLSELLSRSDAA